MSATPRILVLAGGISHERDVSLRSGRRVADSLAEHGITVELRDPDATLELALRALFTEGGEGAPATTAQ